MRCALTVNRDKLYWRIHQQEPIWRESCRCVAPPYYRMGEYRIEVYSILSPALDVQYKRHAHVPRHQINILLRGSSSHADDFLAACLAPSHRIAIEAQRVILATLVTEARRLGVPFTLEALNVSV